MDGSHYWIGQLVKAALDDYLFPEKEKSAYNIDWVKLKQ